MMYFYYAPCEGQTQVLNLFACINLGKKYTLFVYFLFKFVSIRLNTCENKAEYGFISPLLYFAQFFCCLSPVSALCFYMT